MGNGKPARKQQMRKPHRLSDLPTIDLAGLMPRIWFLRSPDFNLRVPAFEELCAKPMPNWGQGKNVIFQCVHTHMQEVFGKRLPFSL
jgi:hypothetical protein